MANKLKITGWALFIIGILFHFVSHVGMLIYGLTPELISPHATSNIFAGMLIIAGFILILMTWKK